MYIHVNLPWTFRHRMKVFHHHRFIDQRLTLSVCGVPNQETITSSSPQEQHTPERSGTLGTLRGARRWRWLQFKMGSMLKKANVWIVFHPKCRSSAAKMFGRLRSSLHFV